MSYVSFKSDRNKLTQMRSFS